MNEMNNPNGFSPDEVEMLIHMAGMVYSCLKLSSKDELLSVGRRVIEFYKEKRKETNVLFLMFDGEKAMTDLLWISNAHEAALLTLEERLQLTQVPFGQAVPDQRHYAFLEVIMKVLLQPMAQYAAHLREQEGLADKGFVKQCLKQCLEEATFRYTAFLQAAEKGTLGLDLEQSQVNFARVILFAEFVPFLKRLVENPPAEPH